MSYAEPKHYIANIDAQKLILEFIWYNARQLELAQVDYYKASLNHDYETLNKANEAQIHRKSLIIGAKAALVYMMAQEEESKGRRVSADMTEITAMVEDLINGNDN